MIRPDGKVDFICMRDPENVVDASKDVCQNCVHYKSRKIEYPIMVHLLEILFLLVIMLNMMKKRRF